MSRRKITTKGLLRFLADYVGDFLEVPYRVYRHRRAELPYRDLEDYFPSTIKQAADRLQRRGLVEKIETAEGTVIKMTDRGKKEVLKFKLEELEPKTGKWDGKWRIVFFDIAELNRHKRDILRKYLKQLGMERLQGSVFISPYDVGAEVKFLREVLDVPHGVKWGVLEWVENEEELKEMFEV